MQETETPSLCYKKPDWPFLRRHSANSAFSGNSTVRSGETRESICGISMEGDKFPAVLMRGAERRLGIVNGDGDGEIKKEGGDEEIVGETVDEEEKVDGGKTSISRLPLFVDPISDYPCPRYIFPGQRPVRSLPSFLEVGPSDTGDHGNEKRMRYLRPRPVSMDTLTPYSIPSQSSTAIVKKDHTLSNLIKSAKGKLTAKKRPNKDIKAKLDKNTPTTNLNMSSSISPSTITLARNEATEIHQLIKECKLYISETLRISKEKMREAEEQGKVVFDAVEQHRLEGESLLTKLDIVREHY